MYPSTRMLTHSRVPHIFSHTYPSDMTCSPPPGKVRHRTFGKLLLYHVSCFPRTALQLYSTPYQAYFLQLYSTAVPRGTLVLEYQSVPRVSMPYVHACTHTQLSDVHCAELMYQPCTHVYSCVHTAAATAVLRLSMIIQS